MKLKAQTAKLFIKGKKAFVIPDEFQVRQTYDYPDWIEERYQIRQITDYKMILCFSKITGGSRKERISKINGARLYQVYLMMHQFMNSKRPFKLFPSQKSIAEKCNCSVRQVNKALQALNQIGILYWKKQFSTVNNYYWYVDKETFEAVKVFQKVNSLNEPTTSQDSKGSLLTSIQVKNDETSIQDNIDETSSRLNQSLPDTEQSNHRKNHKNNNHKKLTIESLIAHAEIRLGQIDYRDFKTWIAEQPKEEIKNIKKGLTTVGLEEIYFSICKHLNITKN